MKTWIPLLCIIALLVVACGKESVTTTSETPVKSVVQTPQPVTKSPSTPEIAVAIPEGTNTVTSGQKRQATTDEGILSDVLARSGQGLIGEVWCESRVAEGTLKFELKNPTDKTFLLVKHSSITAKPEGVTPLRLTINGRALTDLACAEDGRLVPGALLTCTVDFPRTAKTGSSNYAMRVGYTELGNPFENYLQTKYNGPSERVTFKCKDLVETE